MSAPYFYAFYCKYWLKLGLLKIELFELIGILKVLQLPPGLLLTHLARMVKDLLCVFREIAQL